MSERCVLIKNAPQALDTCGELSGGFHSDMFAFDPPFSQTADQRKRLRFGKEGRRRELAPTRYVRADLNRWFSAWKSKNSNYSQSIPCFKIDAGPHKCRLFIKLPAAGHLKISSNIGVFPTEIEPAVRRILAADPRYRDILKLPCGIIL